MCEIQISMFINTLRHTTLIKNIYDLVISMLSIVTFMHFEHYALTKSRNLTEWYWRVRS